MVAVSNIEQDVCIVKIPKKCLLESNNTEIRELIEKSKFVLLKRKNK
jgi:hypothetical protein